MGFLAWIQKQFGIPVAVEKEKSQVSAPTIEGQFKVLRIQPTPNPDAFQFILNGRVIEAGTKTFDSPDDSGDDPMAKALFDIFGIQSVYVKENFVTITKSNVVGWHTIMEKIGGTIEAHLKFYEKDDEAGEDKDIHPVLENFNKEDFFDYNDERKTEVINALLDIRQDHQSALSGGLRQLPQFNNRNPAIH